VVEKPKLVDFESIFMYMMIFGAIAGTGEGVVGGWFATCVCCQYPGSAWPSCRLVLRQAQLRGGGRTGCGACCQLVGSA
jgi:hypothetical protein